MRGRAAGLVLALALGASAGTAQATTVVELSDTQLAANADAIVVGVVVDARPITLELEPRVFTEVTVEVALPLDGHTPLGATLRLRVPGGTVTGDDGAAVRQVEIEGMPHFTVGEEVLLFLERQPAALGDGPSFLPVGLRQGVWRPAVGGWIRGAQEGLIRPLGSGEPIRTRRESAQSLEQIEEWLEPWLDLPRDGGDDPDEVAP